MRPGNALMANSTGRRSERQFAPRIKNPPQHTPTGDRSNRYSGKASVRVNTGLLDNRIPLGDFGLQVLGERIRRGFVFAHRLRAEFTDA